MANPDLSVKIYGAIIGTAVWLVLALGCLSCFAWISSESVTKARRPTTTLTRMKKKYCGESLLGRLPAVSEIMRFISAIDRYNEVDLRRLLKHGPVSTVTVLGQRMLTINRPDLIEHCQSQKARFSNYVKGPIMREAMKQLLGQVATDGHAWFKQRKAAALIFSRNSFTGLIQTTIQRHVAIMVHVIRKRSTVADVLALDQLFMQLTLDAFLDMGFSQKLGSMQSEEPVPFATAFDRAQSVACWRMLLPGWRFWEHFTPYGMQQKRDIQTINEYIYSVIDNRAMQLASGQAQERDLLALFQTIRNDAGEPLSRQELRDAILNLIIAGRDTTAQALAYVFFHLLQRWELYAPAIRQEAALVLGESDAVSFDQHKELVFANAIFHEALRLHPPVSRNIKTAIEDDQIPNGPFVQAGDIVFWSDWSIARDPNGVWGKDAAEFKPERFINEEGKLRRFSSWQFHAFNGGPRLCLGQALATYEAIAAIVAIVLNFDMRFKDDYLKTSPMCTGIVEDLPPTPQHVFSVRQENDLSDVQLTCPLKYPLEVEAVRLNEVGSRLHESEGSANNSAGDPGHTDL